jgi:hypothetical protein
MKAKKLVKSNCQKAWLFNVKQEDETLIAGFACFAHSCPLEVKMEVNGEERMVMLPSRAVNSAVPLRMLNARLSLLPLIDDEQIL